MERGSSPWRRSTFLFTTTKAPKPDGALGSWPFAHIMERVYGTLWPHAPTTGRRTLHLSSAYLMSGMELTKAGLRSDGSRQSSAPSIVSFLRATPPAPQLHSLFLHKDTISNHPTVPLHFAQPSSPRLAYDPSLSLQERRALLRDYFLTEPVLQFHIQEPVDIYNVCTPDGSCAIQLALLYHCLDPVDWITELSSHNPSQPFFKYQRRGLSSSADQSHVLRLVRSLIDSRTEPGSHVRE